MITLDETIDISDTTDRPELEQEQIKLELEQTAIGVKRYREALAKAQASEKETRITPQHKLLLSAVRPLSEHLAKELEDKKRPGRRKAALQILEGIDPDVIAFLTAQVVLNSLSAAITSIHAEKKIASALRDYKLMDKFRGEHPELFYYAMKDTDKSSHMGYKRNRMRHYASYAGTTMEEERIDTLTGAYLLETFIQTTGLVTKRNTNSAKKTKQILRPSEDVSEWMSEEHAKCELMNPFLFPMVVPPLPWTNPYDGGYLTLAMPISKNRSRSYLEELEGANIDSIYRAINALQTTSWRVNQPILEVAQYLWDNVDESSVLPARKHAEIPERPLASLDDTEAFKRLHKDEWMDWKRSASAVHSMNARLDSKRIATTKRLWMATKFKDHEDLYFPHTMDWRGRVYPVVQMLHPQSDDLGKALLEFSKGAPLGDTGEYWLKVHIANCYGVDKVTMEERVAWTEEHAVHISMAANDPLAVNFWKEADDPWQFLAACFEWERYQSSGEGKDFVSHISINMDGSCNGLQNFSAMLRDEVGGKATNLVAQDEPADIYTEVASTVEKYLDEAISNPETLAKPEFKLYAEMWSGKVTRKIVKRQVMTLPYGATEFGMRDQLKQEVYSQKMKGVSILGDVDSETEWQSIRYLTSIIWKAITTVVVAAGEAMDWLRDAAKAATKAELPIFWTAPSGLPVVQDYRMRQEKRIDTIFNKVRVSRRLSRATPKLNSRKQVSGISPNFVHSCDAAHMIATINQCLDIGITEFCMIHDSYGTHAGNVDALQFELRDAFIAQYSENILENFRTELKEQTGLKIPKIPEMGNLDLETIRDSKYFFA